MKRAVEGNDSQQQQQDVMPTLGQVLKEEQFALLHGLLKMVADTPVDQLDEKLREELLEGEDKATRVLLSSFFSACDAAVRAAEQRKRARSGKGGDDGECIACFLFCL